jgi:microcystin degradation protein MlrC
VPEAVEAAMSAKEQPVYLSDSGDNPGAGGTTDVPVLLGELLDRGASNVVVASIWDLAAFSVGGKLDIQNGSPLKVTGTVRLLGDGHRYQGGQRAPWGGGGPVAVLNVRGVDVILSSTRLSFVDPAQLRALGLEPFDYRIVVLKRGYLTAPFQAISERSILALTPGATNCDLRQVSFHRVQRPMYPLDLDATWSPG